MNEVGASGNRVTEPRAFERREYPAAELIERHPPVLRDPNKQILFETSCPKGATHIGRLVYSRWFAMPLPPVCDPGAAAQLADVRDGFFRYLPLAQDPAEPPAVEWYVNFADPRLFGYYGGPFFAQDEILVAEHPALASLREALEAEHVQAVTVDGGTPTPVLVSGVERRLSFAIGPNAAQGRPIGLYGRAFENASPEAVRRACALLDPPTITNVIAMCAPRANYGTYNAQQVEFTLQTAYTAFRAAAIESEQLAPVAGGRPRTIIHSGFWGCGAFGGNRVMMILLQLIAAEMAGLPSLVLHIGDPAGRTSVDRALALAQDLAAVTVTATLIARIAALGLPWGVSNGT